MIPRNQIFFFTAFCATTISQSHWAIESGYSTLLQTTWLGIFATTFCLKAAMNIVVPFLSLLLLLLYCCLLDTITVKPYLDILVLPRIPIVLSMLYMGICISRHIRIQDFKRLLVFSSITGCLLLLIFLYSSMDTLIISVEDSKIEASNKNSVAILILTLVYVIYKLGKFSNLLIKILFICLATTAVTAMILIRCRTAVLTIPILLVCEPIILKDKKAFWSVIGILLSIAFCIFVVFPDIGMFLTGDFLFNDVNTMQMNSMDDRANLMQTGFQAFLDNPLFGSGYKFVENFYLINLFNLGVIGFIPLALFLLWAIVSLFTVDKNEISTLNKMLFILFFLNGALEAESPFGPGTRCFLFWLLLGYSLGERNRHPKLLQVTSNSVSN